MSVLSELEKRLAENEMRIGALIQHLEAHGELEDSLRAAGVGLVETNKQVGQLAQSSKVAVESLDSVLAAFREAVEILRRADPARATEAVTRVESQINSVERGIRKAIGEAASEISNGQDRTKQKLEDEGETIRKAIGELAGGQKEMVQQLREEGQIIRKSIPRTVGYLTLILLLVLLALEVLLRFPTLLSG